MEEVGEHRPPEAVEEQSLALLLERRPHLLVAQLAAGSIGSKRRNSDNLHMRRRDLGRRNTERTEQRNLSGCWRLVALLE